MQTLQQKKKRRAPQKAAPARKRKHAKAEGLSSDEEDMEDEEYLGEGDAELIEDRRERLGIARPKVSKVAEVGF